jgi:ATP-dependent RNA helicase SUPV3L1/SUV3
MTDSSRIVALLGPTNTGKTHRAIERMLEHESGMIGLPLRLLAREVFDRVASKVGRDRVALVTGEEKIVPPRARYYVSTVEAMPAERDVAFVAIDEIQLVAHRERGHVFTDRLLHARGREETWFLGSDITRPLLTSLVPAARAEEHPRLSRLSFAGATKLTRLPPRSAVVAFSVERVYEIAEHLRRTRGGTAIVLGALSPRTRNAQVAMFQAGEVDTIVATDAIGMGLNLDVTHVAFAAKHKFDGREVRELDDAELAQIAGRAGRYVTDGTFGTVAPLELASRAAAAIEAHRFSPLRVAYYRPHDLDFAGVPSLLASLRAAPPRPGLVSVPVEAAEDEAAFARLAAMPEIARTLRAPDDVERLWEIATIPDFRKLLFEAHVEDLRAIFLELTSHGHVRDELFTEALFPLAASSGATDVDELLARIARLRTWSYVANKDWPKDTARWREETRALEDRLSDALHAALTTRFVTTSVKKRPAARARPSTRNVADHREGSASAEDDRRHHPFARLRDFTVKTAAAAPESSTHEPLAALVDAPHEAFAVDRDGTITALGRSLARLTRGPRLSLPQIRMLDVPGLRPGLRSQLERRLLAFARDVAARLLASIEPLRGSDSAPLRGLAHVLDEGLGTARARDVAHVIDELGDAERALLVAQRIVVGKMATYAADLLTPDAIAMRVILLRAAGWRVPTVTAETTSLSRRRPAGSVGRPHFGEAPHEERVLLALGFVSVGRRAVRADLLSEEASSE